MKDIYDEYVGSDFTFDEFKAFCDSCWNEKYGFLTTDITKTLDSSRYRKKFEAQFISNNKKLLKIIRYNYPALLDPLLMAFVPGCNKI